MRKNATIITCGCRFNRFESAEIGERLDDRSDRPMVIVNTCAVTQRSEAKSRRAIQRAVREHPEASIVVTGCLAEMDPAATASIEGVDLVLGNEEKFFAQRYLDEGSRVNVGAVHETTDFLETDAGLMEGRTAAYLKVQNGCDEACSFCVVTKIRGDSRSASPAFVLRRIRELAAQGVKEIVLTGIDLGSYGRDLPERPTLATLLRKMTGHGETRFRLSSINPQDVTPELVAVIADTPNICRHLHVPLQSGSGRILRLMNRGYTPALYRERVEAAARALPGIGLGCDVMAGFPGETESDFRQTCDLIRDLPFSYAHVFSYSPRTNTPACDMNETVPEREKKERVETLKELRADKNRAFRQAMIDTETEVLVENRNTPPRGMLSGKSDTFVQVEFPGTPDMKGGLKRVRVTALSEKGVTAEVVPT